MTTVAENVNVANTGDLSYAPTGTALPDTVDEALNPGFLSIGYISEDGVTQSIGETVTKIKAWQNADVVRVVQTDHSVTYQFTMIENNPNSLAMYYGGNYAAGVGQIKGGSAPHKSWVIQVEDGDMLIRTVISDGQLITRGDVVYKNGEAIGYSCTVEAFPDDDGVKAYVYYATATVSA